MNLAANIFEQLDAANRAAAQHIALGIEQGLREGKAARDALRAILYARDLAPDAMLPTPLMLAIEQARKVL